MPHRVSQSAQRAIAAIWALAACMGWPAWAAEPDGSNGVWTGAGKIVAVGDVHGDVEQFVTVLRSANLIDEQQNWTGGRTHLVQTGDILDRGPDSRKVMDLLMKLEKQAEAAGGLIHALIGNHESMNLTGDFRYTSPGEYAAFRDGNSEAVRDAAYQNERGSQDRVQWNAKHPLGYLEHRAALASTGAYGKWILGHDAVIKINDTLFVHGGISPRYVTRKIRQINEEVRAGLKDPGRPEGGILTDTEGPLWYRGLALGDEKELEPHLRKVLKNFGVERIVVSHTYANAAITPRFAGRVLLIDIGLSRMYDNVGKVGCLVIETGAQPYVLHRGTRLELPADSGKDLLRYLRQAAALDPPPSPLIKRINELETRLASGTP